MKAYLWAGAILVNVIATFGNVRFTVNTDHTNVMPGEQIQITAELLVDKQLKEAAPPPVAPNDAFTVANVRQNQSSSSSIQIINGHMSQTNEIHYVFYYTIVPQKKGAFTFPSLQVTIDNTPYTTEPISFNVAAASQPPAKNADVRVTIQLSKSTLFVGEQAMLTFKVAQRGNAPVQIDGGINNALVDAIEKSFSKNFSLTRLFSNQLPSGSERIGGEIYRTVSLRYAIIPLAAGTTAIPAVPFSYVELHQVRQQGGDPFFNDFFGGAFGGGVQQIQRTAFSNELTIHAKELPPPPAGFAGAIGKISLTAAVTPAVVPAGEAATLNVLVSAATRPGNVAEVTAPKLAGCEIFTPEKHTQVDTTAEGITTRKAYKFLLIPGQEGQLDIPPIAVIYFDPAVGSYQTASSGPISLTVTPGKGGSKPQTRYLTQEEIHELGSDIRYIKTDVALRNVSEKPYREPLFLLLYPLPFVMFFVSFLYKVQSKRHETNAAFYVRARALKSARRAFDGLRRRGLSLSAERFLGQVAETIERYLSQKFEFAATGRTLEDLRAELLLRNVDEAIVNDLTKFIELLDSYRFGGASFDEKSRSAVLDKSIAFAASLERGAKRGGKSLNIPTALLVLWSLLLVARAASAAPVNLWFEQANRFYTAQSYDSAVAYYEKIVSSGMTSPAVYFNLGNAYYRLKKLGMCRLSYEKAARLDPADADVAANIKFLSSNIVDRVDEPARGFIEVVVDRLHFLMPLRAQLWFCFAVLLCIAILCSSALYASGNRRLWLIYVSVLLGLILVASGGSMIVKIVDAESTSYAILLDASTDARNEPEGAKILFTAHEGTKFQIRKSVEGWSLVSLPNGSAGWVENKSLGKI
ncbi:MAG: BatD family protein [Chitinispirillaceae bacterium]|jgi:tetratricopeptide (TPR) repeat protein